MRTYAIGDIHGHLDKLAAAHRLIAQDRHDQADPDAPVVHVGDLVDRGPDSRGVLDFLLAGLGQGEPWVVLKGNHDRMFAGFLDDPAYHDPGLRAELNWIHPRLGGAETLASYGIDADTATSLRAAGKAFGRALPSSHRRFLGDALLCHEEGDYFFCHAGVKPGIAFEAQQPADLLWIRHEFLQHQGDFGKVVVHGHTPWDRVDIQPNRINVDTGAYDTGILSCVVLEGRDIRVLQADGPGG